MRITTESQRPSREIQCFGSMAVSYPVRISRLYVEQSSKLAYSLAQSKPMRQPMPCSAQKLGRIEGAHGSNVLVPYPMQKPWQGPDCDSSQTSASSPHPALPYHIGKPGIITHLSMTRGPEIDKLDCQYRTQSIHSVTASPLQKLQTVRAMQE